MAGIVLGGALDRGQAVVPEALQHPLGFGQAFGPRSIEPLRPVPAFLNQARLLIQPG
jgi:hypothetical protein